MHPDQSVLVFAKELPLMKRKESKGIGGKSTLENNRKESTDVEHSP